MFFFFLIFEPNLNNIFVVNKWVGTVCKYEYFNEQFGSSPSTERDCRCVHSAFGGCPWLWAVSQAPEGGEGLWGDSFVWRTESRCSPAFVVAGFRDAVSVQTWPPDPCRLISMLLQYGVRKQNQNLTAQRCFGVEVEKNCFLWIMFF